MVSHYPYGYRIGGRSSDSGDTQQGYLSIREWLAGFLSIAYSIIWKHNPDTVEGNGYTYSYIIRNPIWKPQLNNSVDLTFFFRIFFQVLSQLFENFSRIDVQNVSMSLWLLRPNFALVRSSDFRPSDFRLTRHHNRIIEFVIELSCNTQWKWWNPFVSICGTIFKRFPSKLLSKPQTRNKQTYNAHLDSIAYFISFTLIFSTFFHFPLSKHPSN